MMPGGWKCPRRVGFLFPQPCQRVTPEGCPDCQNGNIRDPYSSRTDRGDYGSDYDLESDNAETFAFGGGDSGGGGASMDFSEADGATLINTDESFENDLSAS
jgi:hypothetical protein